MNDLTTKKCVPCEGGALPLSPKQAQELAVSLVAWHLDKKKLTKRFTFKDFAQAMIFVNEIARIAEEEQHHPDITISFNIVTLTLTTHAIDGLSENDFILAAKIDEQESNN